MDKARQKIVDKVRERHKKVAEEKRKTYEALLKKYSEGSIINVLGIDATVVEVYEARGGRPTIEFMYNHRGCIKTGKILVSVLEAGEPQQEQNTQKGGDGSEDTKVVCSRAATRECVSICAHSNPHEPAHLAMPYKSCQDSVGICPSVANKQCSCIPYNLVDRD